mgnify:CR=1 FL=1
MILTGGSACIFNYWAIITVNTKGVLGTGGTCHIGWLRQRGAGGASGIMERKGWRFRYRLYKYFRQVTGKPLIEIWMVLDLHLVSDSVPQFELRTTVRATFPS